ncbi:DMT family transporter [Opitutus terrae]|uniref:EamA domain-containing protein n=1 Tax=Opitutus terrae (strain DSM 11246 / JCM 15787 / PB90-1) TaxID=452637 RepID=B1ZTP0_OPITP|nr:DMT family transporter [Opitutus terrae]ACB74826.1 protein of unknown function DUF6 transmembrane [Opitutus terrae PB90-1]
MIGALGTTLLFACNALFANRSAKMLGSNQANLARLAVAVIILGTWAHVAGQGIGGAGFGWFFVSGLVGFGIGGVAMFQALPRLGSPLAMLIVQCGSALVAAAGERLWLGTQLAPVELTFVALTLLGVALGLMPRGLPGVPPAALRAGAAWAFLSAAGQGLGAVLSRRAFQTIARAHEFIDPPTSAYQRALAGLGVAVVAVAIGYSIQCRNRAGSRRAGSPDPAALSPAGTGEISAGPEDPALHSQPRAWPWVFANALCGPVLGVTCFQWALSTTPAGIVQSIVATAPLATIPLAMWFEHSRPRALYYAGAVLAVAGIIGLFLTR